MNQRMHSITGCALATVLLITMALPAQALDLVGFIGFVVALISLSALRNFGPVLFYVGLAIFAAVGLVIDRGPRRGGGRGGVVAPGTG